MTPMKKVRFESPCKLRMNPSISDSDCHSPRPYLHNPLAPKTLDSYNENAKVLVYSPDPIHRFEASDSVPYPTATKSYAFNTNIPAKYTPSNDLELSMLDATNHIPRKFIHPLHAKNTDSIDFIRGQTRPQIFSAMENALDPTAHCRPNTLVNDNDFFIKRDDIDKHWNRDFKFLQNKFNSLSVDKENNPLEQKAKMMRDTNKLPTNPVSIQQASLNSQNTCQPLKSVDTERCKCHHCIPALSTSNKQYPIQTLNIAHNHNVNSHIPHSESTRLQSCEVTAEKAIPPADHCPCMQPLPPVCCCRSEVEQVTITNRANHPSNNFDKASWKLERIEKMNKENLEIEKQTNVSNEKREPTVADLFEIIKMQNKQLQLLQEKVDTFISSASNHGGQNFRTATPHITEQAETCTRPQMSIGVMTSFEMIRTSTIINKEIVKQTTENAQVQCNQSLISIKEVISRTQPVNLNFLDGISPKSDQNHLNGSGERPANNSVLPCETVQEDKTYNELSLYNIQVNNPITPLISPEQSLYLDVRDYSDSDSSSSDQSNVGWTYYNKVMTHVNGMLQDSDMPSSASALFRNMKQQCVQRQIDKTNISVAKRVKFGDDPLGIHQPHIYGGSTDTSLKMNELAAKYLRSRPSVPVLQTLKQTGLPVEMSFATRNYMERHQILQAPPSAAKSPTTDNIPRFLDITALKSKPKLL